MDEEYQQKMAKLQKFFNNEIRIYDELLADNGKMSAELHQLQTHYYSTKFDTENELDQLIAEELQITNQISRRHAYHADGFRKEFTKMVHEMDVVLGAYDTEKKAERTTVTQTFQKFKEIPKNFGNDVMLGKIEIVDDKIAGVTAEIGEITHEIGEMREAYVAESIHEQDANLRTVVADLKTTNVKLTLFFNMKK